MRYLGSCLLNEWLWLVGWEFLANFSGSAAKRFCFRRQSITHLLHFAFICDCSWIYHYGGATWDSRKDFMYLFSCLNCFVAMRPKSAFIPASVPLLSHDTGDDEDDDDDERQKGASSSKGISFSSWSVVNSQQMIFLCSWPWWKKELFFRISWKEAFSHKIININFCVCLMYLCLWLTGLQTVYYALKLF